MHACRRAAILAVCFVEVTVLGSALFGWASLVFVLQEEGLYHHVCQIPETNTSVPLPAASRTEAVVPETSTRCQQQKVALSVPYTVAIVVFGVGALPVGWFFDRFGLRKTRTITAFVGATGYLQLAFVSPGTEWLAMLGAAFVGISCYVIIMTTSYVALLAEPKASIMNAINNSGIGTSFAYTAIKLLYERGFSRLYCLVFMSALHVVVLLSSWVLLPANKLEEAPPEGGGRPEKGEYPSEKPAAEKDCLASKETHIHKVNQPCPKVGVYHRKLSIPTPSIKRPMAEAAVENGHVKGGGQEGSLRQYLLSGTFLLFLYWFCAHHVRVGMMIAGYDVWMTQVVKGDLEKVSYFTDVMAYAVLAGVVTTPIPGVLTDYIRLKLSSEPHGTATAMIPALTITSVVMSLITVPMFFSSEYAIFFAVVMFAIGKPCLYSTISAFVGLLCPREHFGLVFGIANLVSGVASFMIHAYLVWVAKSGSFVQVNAFLFGTTILSLALPLKLLVDRWRHQRAQRRQLQSKGSLEHGLESRIKVNGVLPILQENEELPTKLNGDLSMVHVNNNVSMDKMNGDLPMGSANKVVSMDRQNGELSIGHVNKAMSMDQQNGDLPMGHVNKAMSMDQQNGDLPMGLVNKAMSMDQQNGDLPMGLVNKAMSMDQQNGDLPMGLVNKAMSMDQQNGDLSMGHVNNAMSTDQQNGDLPKGHVNRAMSMDQQAGELSMNQESGNLSVPQKHGGLSINQGSGGTPSAKTNGLMAIDKTHSTVTPKVINNTKL